MLLRIILVCYITCNHMIYGFNLKNHQRISRHILSMNIWKSAQKIGQSVVNITRISNPSQNEASTIKKSFKKSISSGGNDSRFLEDEEEIDQKLLLRVKENLQKMKVLSSLDTSNEKITEFQKLQRIHLATLNDELSLNILGTSFRSATLVSSYNVAEGGLTKDWNFEI